MASSTKAALIGRPRNPAKCGGCRLSTCSSRSRSPRTSPLRSLAQGPRSRRTSAPPPRKPRTNVGVEVAEQIADHRARRRLARQRGQPPLRRRRQTLSGHPPVTSSLGARRLGAHRPSAGRPRPPSPSRSGLTYLRQNRLRAGRQRLSRAPSSAATSRGISGEGVNDVNAPSMLEGPRRAQVQIRANPRPRPTTRNSMRRRGLPRGRFKSRQRRRHDPRQGPLARASSPINGRDPRSDRLPRASCSSSRTRTQPGIIGYARHPARARTRVNIANMALSRQPAGANRPHADLPARHRTQRRWPRRIEGASSRSSPAKFVQRQSRLNPSVAKRLFPCSLALIFAALVGYLLGALPFGQLRRRSCEEAWRRTSSKPAPAIPAPPTCKPRARAWDRATWSSRSTPLKARSLRHRAFGSTLHQAQGRSLGCPFSLLNGTYAGADWVPLRASPALVGTLLGHCFSCFTRLQAAVKAWPRPSAACLVLLPMGDRSSARRVWGADVLCPLALRFPRLDRPRRRPCPSPAGSCRSRPP